MHITYIKFYLIEHHITYEKDKLNVKCITKKIRDHQSHTKGNLFNNKKDEKSFIF